MPQKQLTIRLKRTLPIENAEGHGAVAGATFQVSRIKKTGCRGRLYVFTSKLGVECAAYLQEVEFVQ